ncbi:MAG: hypothetical protein JRF71_09095 [Deltaproteobacteria bacterium]|nr:hypothetical protein [Deltaproteobacteria bacterium]MBW2538860.1 hypothetical protein [Deltaproteobacteria bacterium]
MQASFFFPAFPQGCLSLQITVFAEPATHDNLPLPCLILTLKLIRMHLGCEEALHYFIIYA